MDKILKQLRDMAASVGIDKRNENFRREITEKSGQLTPEDSRQTGTVTAWYFIKAFGYIAPDDGGDDLYFKSRDSWKSGQRVSYLPSGDKALFVRPLD